MPRAQGRAPGTTCPLQSAQDLLQEIGIALGGLGVLLGAVAVVSGLLISFHYGTAGGATIAGLSVLQFFAALTIREMAAAIRRPSGSTALG